MSASLDGLPAETQLAIFQLLVPEDPNNPERRDLANLRLTCKALLACATEVYFEHHYMLIRQQGDIYYQPRAYELFLQQPELAAMVKTVWVAHAVATPDWLRRQAGFCHFEVPNEEESLKLAYMATPMFHSLPDTCVESDDTDDGDFDYDYQFQLCREDADFTAAQYKSIKKYYRQYIARPAYLGYYGTPSTRDSLKTLLEKRLRTFPTLNHLRFVRPPIAQTPFHEERYAFWMSNGLEEWAYDLSKPREGHFKHGSFPWHPEAVGLSLDVLPSTCKSLELDVLLYEGPFGAEEPLQSDKAQIFREQLNSLTMLLELSTYSGGNQLREEIPLSWARFVNQFNNITDLSLCHSSHTLRMQDVHYYDHDQSFEYFLEGISLPNIRRLSLKSWVLHANRFKNLHAHFPNLHELRVSDLAIKIGSAKSRKSHLHLWHVVSKYINQGYNGKCALIFDSGPIVECQGGFEDYTVFDYCLEEDPAITCVVKVPAQEVLTALSQAVTAAHDLSCQYFKLIQHKRPATVFTTIRELKKRDKDGDCDPHYQCVDTPGMTYVYYEVMEEDEDYMNWPC